MGRSGRWFGVHEEAAVVGESCHGPWVAWSVGWVGKSAVRALIMSFLGVLGGIARSLGCVLVLGSSSL